MCICFDCCLSRRCCGAAFRAPLPARAQGVSRAGAPRRCREDKRICIYIYIYIYIYVYIDTHIYTHIIYVYMYTCVYIYIYIYICTHNI